MPREVQEPTRVEKEGSFGGTEEEHPAYALIGASRVSSTPGAVLFDSDIQHGHSVIVHISTASRRRANNHDHTYAEKQLIEVQMSEAQWASFVSSMNTGPGVPCTMLRREGEMIPGLPYAPRLAESMKEVRGAAEKYTQNIADAFAAYEEKKTAENLRSLRAAIENAPANMAYVAESLTEHAENVVQRARVDVESMVTAKAEQVGLPSELGKIQLMPGEE